MISFLGLFTNSVPALGAYPLDNASNVLNALLITYTIVRYRLLDLTLVLRRGLTWGLILFVVGLIYLFSLVVGQAIASATWLGILVAVVALTALALAVVPGILESAQAAIDRLLFRGSLRRPPHAARYQCGGAVAAPIGRAGDYAARRDGQGDEYHHGGLPGAR